MIYITGDTHIPVDIRKLNTDNFPEQKNLTKDDFVIILGDFGLLWSNDWDNKELYWKKWLEDKPFTTLFIDGNHENFDRLNAYKVETWHGGKVHKISDSIIHLMRGQVFTIDNRKVFTFGGAYSHDRGLATLSADIDRGVCWWDEEMPTLQEMKEGRKNLAVNGNQVDYILTHDIPTRAYMRLYSHPTYLNCLNDYLSEIQMNTKFKKWFAGHHHINKKIDNIQILYNSIEKL